MRIHLTNKFSLGSLLMLGVLLAATGGCTKSRPQTDREDTAVDNQNTSETPKQDPAGLSCTLAARDTYEVGNPVELEFSLTNNGDRTVHVLRWYTPFEGLGGDIFKITHNDRELPYQGMMVKRGDPTAGVYIELPPGETRSAAVDLAQGYDLSQPGPYQVRFRGELPDVCSDPDQVPRPRSAHQPASIECGAVEVTIKAAH